MKKLIVLLLAIGCGGGGGDSTPDTQTTSSTAVEQCGDSTVNITVTATAEEVNDIVDEAISGGDDVVVEEVPQLDQSGVLRLYKVTIVSGCHNAVVDQDDHTVNDNDTNINLSGGA